MKSLDGTIFLVYNFFMVIAELYKMTFEEFRAYVVNNRVEARLILETEERFNLLKIVTRNNSLVRQAPRFYHSAD